jgi:hypothetical protein
MCGNAFNRWGFLTMRPFIFAFCTLLSSAGFFCAFFLKSTARVCNLQIVECLSQHQRFSLVIGYLVYIAMLIFALIAYFRMGIAWIERRRLGLFWPIFGTMAAVLTLCGAGITINGDVWLHLGLIKIGGIMTAPAIALAIWMALFHVRRA